MREDKIHIRLHYHCSTHNMNLDPGIEKSNPGIESWAKMDRDPGVGTPTSERFNIRTVENNLFNPTTFLIIRVSDYAGSTVSLHSIIVSKV